MRNQAGRALVRVLVGAGVVVLVLLVGAFVALSLVDWNKHVALAASEVKRATGRELKVGGKVEIGVLPPRIIVEEVSLSNAPWGSRPEMAKAKRVEVSAALLPLLVGNVRLELDVVAPDVLLETDAKGVGNWVMGRARKAAKSDASSESKEFPVDLSAAQITNGLVRYRSGKTGRTRELAFDEASVRSTGLAGREVRVKAAIDGVPATLTARTDAWIIRTLAAGEPLAVKLEAKVANATLAADGQVGFPATGASLDLKVRAEVPEPKALAALAGARLPLLSRLPWVKLEGEVKSGKRVHAIEDIKLAAGKSSASGAVKVDLSGARPRLSVDVAAPLIDLLELSPTEAPVRAGKRVASGRVFAPEPLPLEALRGFDADANLKIDRLALPPALLLEGVRGRIVLAAGKLETRGLDMRMGGGDVKVDGALDARGAQRAQLSARVAGSGIELGKMVAALGKESVMTGGRTEIDARLGATGDSPAALAASLNGHLKIVMGPARTDTRVIDRAGMDVLNQVLNAVNPMRKIQDHTQIQCAVVNVPVQNGVVTVDRTIAIETTQVGIAMAGTVDLGAETLDLSIRPQQKEGVSLSVGGLANLVKLEGTLADPKVGVDVAGAASAAAQIGIGVMTSGLSLLAKGLFDKATMEAPCKTALQAGEAGQSGGGIGGFFDRLLK